MTLVGTEIQLVCIPPKDVRKIWGGVVDMIDAGFAAFDVPMPADIIEQIEADMRQLWVAVADNKIKAAMLTQIFEMRSGKVVKALECGGEDLYSWLPLRTGIEEFAKREHCVRVIVEGRPGWSRLLPDYKMIAVTLEKRI